MSFLKLNSLTRKSAAAGSDAAGGGKTGGGFLAVLAVFAVLGFAGNSVAALQDGEIAIDVSAATWSGLEYGFDAGDVTLVKTITITNSSDADLEAGDFEVTVEGDGLVLGDYSTLVVPAKNGGVDGSATVNVWPDDDLDAGEYSSIIKITFKNSLSSLSEVESGEIEFEVDKRILTESNIELEGVNHLVNTSTPANIGPPTINWSAYPDATSPEWKLLGEANYTLKYRKSGTSNAFNATLPTNGEEAKYDVEVAIESSSDNFTAAAALVFREAISIAPPADDIARIGAEDRRVRVGAVLDLSSAWKLLPDGAGDAEEYIDLAWNSSENSVATVTDGVVTAVGNGTTEITLVAKSMTNTTGFTLTWNITVFGGPANVTFDVNGGSWSGSGTVTPVVTTSGKLLATDISTKNALVANFGYALVGWNTNPNGSGTAIDANYVFTDDRTIYAQWVSTTGGFAVKLNLEGGVSPQIAVLANKDLATPDATKKTLAAMPVAPTKDGYAFTVWTKTNTTPVAGDTITLTTEFTYAMATAGIYARYMQTNQSDVVTISWNDVANITYRADGLYGFKPAKIEGKPSWVVSNSDSIFYFVQVENNVTSEGEFTVTAKRTGSTGTTRDSALVRFVDNRTKDISGVIKIGMYATFDSATGANRKRFRTRTAYQNITIAKKDIALCTLAVVTPNGQLVYDGTDQTPVVRLKDGVVVLESPDAYPVDEGDFFDYVVNNDLDGNPLPQRNLLNWRNADTAWVIVQGEGNYTGRLTRSFVIAKKQIEVLAVAKSDKVYDGTTTIDTAVTYSGSGTSLTEEVSSPRGGIALRFDGLVSTEELRRSATASGTFSLNQYRLTNVTLSNANVGDNRTVTATVVLTDNAVAKNYTLKNANVSVPGVKVIQRNTSHWNNNGVTVTTGITGSATYGTLNVDSTAFSFAIPTNHYDLGTGPTVTARGIGAVTYKTPLINPLTTGTGNATLTTLYTYLAESEVADFTPIYNGTFPATGLDTTIAPKKVGKYIVKVRVGSGGLNVAGAVYPLGVYEIKAAVAPVFVAGTATAGTAADGKLPTNASIGQGERLVLKVNAESPNGGILTYSWYKVETGKDPVLQAAQADPEAFVVPTGSKGTFQYQVIVTNSHPAIQVPETADGGTITVTVADPPVSLTGVARITVEPGKTWEYTGYEIVPESDFITVEFPDSNVETGWKPLTYGTDFSLGGFNNVVVGTGYVLATGIATNGAGYKGAVSTTFNITKKPLGADDLDMTRERPYDGKKTGAQITVAAPKTGLGNVTKVTYNNSTVVPDSIGVYQVVVDVAEGANFTAGSNIYMGTYTITMGVLDTSCFDYTIPTGHLSTNATGIVYKGFVKGTGYGTVKIIYGTDTSGAVPKVNGSYQVYAIVSGGSNYPSGRVLLGTYVVGPVSVAEVAREIPKTDATAEASVAPVKALSASFTAGPSPVSLNGAIKFFSAKQVKSGKLFVFDANGNAAAKVSVKAGTGEIASWNLKDKKGASVAEGTYVVKGVLVGKDGTKEKVSFVFSVVK